MSSNRKQQQDMVKVSIRSEIKQAKMSSTSEVMERREAKISIKLINGHKMPKFNEASN